VLTLLGVIQTASYVAVVLLFTGTPAHGVFLPPWLELMLTVWLTGVAGLAMGLFISAASANLDLALSITPSSIIPQMLLAGALFALPGSVDFLSNATIGKWAVNALGTTAERRPGDRPARPGRLQPPQLRRRPGPEIDRGGARERPPPPPED